MQRNQLIEKGDYVSLCSLRCERLELYIQERIKTNMKRLSKEKKLTLEEVRNAEIFYIVTGTEEKKNEQGDKELYIKIGIGDDVTSIPAITTLWLYRKETLVDSYSRLPCSNVFISIVNHSNFINKKWLMKYSIIRASVHDSPSMIIPYHMMKTKAWKSTVAFHKKRRQEETEN